MEGNRDDESDSEMSDYSCDGDVEFQSNAVYDNDDNEPEPRTFWVIFKSPAKNINAFQQDDTPH